VDRQSITNTSVTPSACLPGRRPIDVALSSSGARRRVMIIYNAARTTTAVLAVNT